jgi:nicotinamidase-related amidase
MAAPAKNQNLHGNVPDTASVVLLLIDVINDFDFEGAEPIYQNFREIAPRIAALKKKARQANIPVVYVNDNFGKWQSDFQKLIKHCLRKEARGKKEVSLLKPDKDDYFVLKPKHSAFYLTTLDVLLDYLKAKTLIMAGITGNICVLFTANDAFMRDFQLIIPQDCVASTTEEENRHAILQMETVLKADTTPSTRLDLQRFTQENASASK